MTENCTFDQTSGGTSPTSLARSRKFDRFWNIYGGFRVTHRRVCLYRARRAEARIQQMLWKVNYSDIVFDTTVCVYY